MDIQETWQFIPNLYVRACSLLCGCKNAEYHACGPCPGHSKTLHALRNDRSQSLHALQRSVCKSNLSVTKKSVVVNMHKDQKSNALIVYHFSSLLVSSLSLWWALYERAIISAGLSHWRSYNEFLPKLRLQADTEGMELSAGLTRTPRESIIKKWVFCFIRQYWWNYKNHSIFTTTWNNSQSALFLWKPKRLVAAPHV